MSTQGDSSDVWCRILNRVRRDAGKPGDPRSAQMIAESVMADHGIKLVPGRSVVELSVHDHHLRGEVARGDWDTNPTGSDKEPSEKVG